MSTEFHVSTVSRDPVSVMYLATADNVDAFGPLWVKLEETVGLRGRKFYGAFFPGADTYHVCVERRNDDDPGAYALQCEELPGGRYLRHRLRGDAPAIYEHIEPTFQRLRGIAEMDPSRPGLEYYRAHDEIDCLLPITSA
jgi:hypothetical protein